MENLVIIDNYDSFTYNLVHLVSPMVNNLEVIRNDNINHSLMAKADGIILSPGPGLPKDANNLFAVIENYHLTHKILGVCLGHQAIAEFFGSNLNNLSKVKHGISTEISILDNEIIYRDMPNSFLIGHYHSWIVEDISDDFIVTSRDKNDQIMSFRHKKLKLFGLQYHPESILTENGAQILQNWIDHT